MARTLIICPTFDHVDALLMSISSVRAQTDPDWEMVVIGDGAPARTADIVAGFSRVDPRVRFEGHAKSPRTGEPYRDGVIRASDAEFVLHLGDDDLWSRHHIDAMLRLLEHADWAHQALLAVSVSGQFTWDFSNIGVLRARQAWSPYRIDARGLNNVGYRRSAYESLANGWDTTPADQATDAAMWAKFLSRPNIRVSSSSEATALKLPSGVARAGAVPIDRAIEAGWYLSRINDASFLSDTQAISQLGIVPLRAMLMSEAAHLSSFECALAACGWHVTAPGTPFGTSCGAEPMRVPITPAQRDTLFFAFEIAQALEAGSVSEELIGMARVNRPLIGKFLRALSVDDHAVCEKLIELVDGVFGFGPIAQIGRLRLSLRRQDAALTAQLLADSKTKWPGANWIAGFETQLERF